MIVFNKMALVLGGISLLTAIIAGSMFGWMKNKHDGYTLLTGGALLAVLDLGYRLRDIKRINVAPPSTKANSDGPIPTRPEPFTQLLNLLLSGERGAQFFWVVAGWILGIAIICFGIAEMSKTG